MEYFALMFNAHLKLVSYRYFSINARRAVAAALISALCHNLYGRDNNLIRHKVIFKISALCFYGLGSRPCASIELYARPRDFDSCVTP